MSPQKVLVCVLLGAATADAGLLWVHSPPSISIAIDTTTGMPASVNSSTGYSTGLNALSWLGEAAGNTTSVSASPCGQSTVCVNRTLVVIGQLSNASCCATYSVVATDVYRAVEAPGPGLPSSIAWSFSVADAVASNPWRTRIVTSVGFEAAEGNSSDALVWVPRGGDFNTGGYHGAATSLPVDDITAYLVFLA